MPAESLWSAFGFFMGLATGEWAIHKTFNAEVEIEQDQEWSQS